MNFDLLGAGLKKRWSFPSVEVRGETVNLFALTGMVIEAMKYFVCFLLLFGTVCDIQQVLRAVRPTSQPYDWRRR